MLLHGVIDSPDIPLNVSRSYLQADSNVRKISGYITKKVAEKLNDLFKEDRVAYEKKWDDIGTFVKYGILSDTKFEEKAMAFALFKNLENQYFTLDEYKEKVKANQTNKDSKLVLLYTPRENEQYSFVQAAKNKGYDILIFDQVIDNHFMQHLEYKHQDITFKRIDSDVADQLIDKGEDIVEVLTESEKEKVSAIFKAITEGSMAQIEVKSMDSTDDPVVIVRPEFMRRMTEMQMLSGMGGAKMPEMFTVVVNAPPIAR